MEDLKKRALFKDLAVYPKYEAGVRAGLDKIYSNKRSLVSSVTRIYQEIKANPEKFTITPDVIEMVDKGLTDRKFNTIGVTQGNKPTIYEGKEKLDEMDIKELIETGSKKAWMLYNKKLDSLLKSKKAMKNVSISAIAQAGGIVFDKRQIVRGEATEHISLKAKISNDLTPKQKMELILSMREKITRPLED